MGNNYSTGLQEESKGRENSRLNKRCLVIADAITTVVKTNQLIY